MTTLWGIIIGQYTTVLVEAIRAEHSYEDKEEVYNSIWLLRTIKKIVSGVTTFTQQIPHRVYFHQGFLQAQTETG